MNAVEAIATVSDRRPSPPDPAGGVSAAGGFGEVLGAAVQSAERPSLRSAAGQLVASTFVQPVLGALRESVFREGPFAPGLAERQFAPLLEGHLADRIVQGGNFPLVDLLVEHLGGARGRTSDG